MKIEAFTEPFRHWILDDFVEPELVRASHDCLPPLAWGGWVRYANDCERKRTSRDIGQLGAPAHRLFAALTSAEVLAKLSGLTDIPRLQPDATWHGAGVHISDPGDYLQAHADYEIHPHQPELERRLNLILPLHQEWRPEWGGELLLFDAIGNTVKRWPPSPGRVVLFECGNASFHGVRATTADAPARITAAVYYLAPKRPSAHRMRAMFFPNRASPGVPHEVK